MLHPAIIGAGATGAYLAARFTRAGTPVTLAARGASAERIAEQGISVSDGAGTWIAHPARVVDTGAGVTGPKPDLIIVCVKTYDTEAALPAINALRGPNTAVLSLQNGVRVDELLAKEVGAAHVLSGVLYIGAHRTDPGVVECTAPARVLLGPYRDGGTRHSVIPAREVAELFIDSGIETTVDDTILTAKWQKFLFNCGLNPLTALTGRTMGTILADPVLNQMYLDLVTEAANVGRASGAPLAPDAVEKAVTTAQRMDISSSMAQDLAAGRPLELDAFSGHVLRLADHTGHSVPVTTAIHALLRAASQ